MHGWELRLSANQFADDVNIIRCPLKRSICNYDANDEFIDCPDQDVDPLHLVGYTLTIQVNKIDQYFSYWRGVKSCNIVPIEATTRLQDDQQFQEVIVLQHSAEFSDVADFSKLGLFMGIMYCHFYGVLYFCRRRRCVYCQGKLVFSTEMCHRCKFVGADPPDPVLVAALHAKGEHIQGAMPERFPGSRKAVKWYRQKRDAFLAFKAQFQKTHPEDFDEYMTSITEGSDPLSLLGLVEIAKKNKQASMNVDAAGAGPAAAGAGLAGAGAGSSNDNDKENDADDNTEAGDLSLGTLDTDMQVEDDTRAAEKKAKKVAYEKARADWEAATKAAERFNFFPFKWKWPRWMVKYLGFSNKKKKNKEAKVNKNLIDMPRHIIYKAIGHHAPPAPDEEYLKKKREIFKDKLGYVPGHLLPKDDPGYHAEGEGGIGEVGSGSGSEGKGEQPLTGMQAVIAGAKTGAPLAWQANKTRPRTPPPIEKKSMIGSWFRKDPNAFKRSKTWAEHERYTCPPLKLIIPTCCCVLCALGLLGFCFLYIFQIVDFTEYIPS